MAVFEKKREDRVLVDDSKPLICVIKEAQNVNGHIEYSLEVWRIPDEEQRWTVLHRFSDFAQIHASLKVPSLSLPQLPPKKIFGNTDRDFINERKAALQKYLDELLANPHLARSLLLRRFLDPATYSGNFIEDARQNVHLALRSGGTHEVTEHLPGIGTRIHKQHFLATPNSSPKVQHVLWWAPFGPDRSLHVRDVHAVLTALGHCQHPYIIPAVTSIATECGVCVVRPWFSQGSLRDLIFQSRPGAPSLVKYCSDKRSLIPERDCAVFGRQILIALQFLHKKGVGHGNLHTGNIIIENNICKLSELENQVVGLPNYYRHHLVNHRRINSMEAVDMFCFGHILYEMVFHRTLDTDTCNEFPEDCSPLCRSVLESIISPEACRNGLPTVAGLLTHPFFNQVPLHSFEKPVLRLSSAVKQAIAKNHEVMFSRLTADQKKVRYQRKLAKAEAIISHQSSVRSKSRKTGSNMGSPNGMVAPDSTCTTPHSSGATTPSSDITSLR